MPLKWVAGIKPILKVAFVPGATVVAINSPENGLSRFPLSHC
jgi:hypothetical protein